ncbi:response regulator [Chloroflexus sp.]|uniref:response regulator n=1 Tax=Chloroflexus sp. TaxID=1904827 RepID=UPI002ACD7543|nr:response regulator [Chloroflexus sp.]
MNKSPSAVEQFIHQLVSPLTALQSAVDLLAHHYGQSDDQRLRNLIASLQRSTARLRQFSQLLTGRVQVEGDMIVARVPLETYQPAALAQPMNTSFGSIGAGVAVLVGGVMLDTLANVLVSAGWGVERVATCAAGLDTARRRRPRLMVIASEALDIEPLMCGQIARTDPETREVAVAIASCQPLSAGGLPVLDLNQPLLEQIQRLLTAHHREREVPRILLVDDEADIRVILGQQLTDTGFAVVTAPDGATALRLAASQHFDLIVLDRLLPDGDGLQVLRILRAQQGTRLTPVMLLSAVSALDEKVRSLQLGADDYVVKPCSAAELAARIRSILRRSERDSSVNPLSRLPGNVVIEQVVHERLAGRQPFAVAYIDLDHFKGYNDHYGFFKGDAVIAYTARLLADIVHWEGEADDFLGHLGGDDFVFVTTLE